MIEPKRVHEIVTECLFAEGEDTSNHVKAEGVILRAGFHPGRLQEHKAEIGDLLRQLPTTFREKGEGGGATFLLMTTDQAGEQWGEQRDADALLVLGVATGQARVLLPRDMWFMLPGGVPYVCTTVTP